MPRIRLLLCAALAAGLLPAPAVSQPPTKLSPPKNSGPQRPALGAEPKNSTPPRLLPVAETKLVCEGLNQANFAGLERILKGDRIDPDTWTFARGQALLIGEAGNLLMMRPPKNGGQNAWMQAGSDLRESASALAKVVARHDVAASRAGLINLANSCNSCHQTFRVATKVTPFEELKP
ncbi:MAG: cytochrome c [Gemmataceae bacterium]